MWSVQKNCPILSASQIQNLNQLPLGPLHFPTPQTVCFVYTLISDGLPVIFYFALIGCSSQFGLGFSELSLDVLYKESK